MLKTINHLDKLVAIQSIFKDWGMLAGGIVEHTTLQVDGDLPPILPWSRAVDDHKGSGHDCKGWPPIGLGWTHIRSLSLFCLHISTTVLSLIIACFTFLYVCASCPSLDCSFCLYPEYLTCHHICFALACCLVMCHLSHDPQCGATTAMTPMHPRLTLSRVPFVTKASCFLSCMSHASLSVLINFSSPHISHCPLLITVMSPY
jgi:hypothetical protein